MKPLHIRAETVQQSGAGALARTDIFLPERVFSSGRKPAVEGFRASMTVSRHHISLRAAHKHADASAPDRGATRQPKLSA